MRTASIKYEITEDIGKQEAKPIRNLQDDQITETKSEKPTLEETHETEVSL